ncbi:hypothetical protein CDAR_558411 [Caerostris darwini]|uniref:Uncharacterized protein n=1 Tax=Caerostris darwini TaxID=1538125 RepID=A0AAV4UNV9_9ARAC|nr:hypothetical protein CDAR_558411 [Caerostris darwini]
MIYYALFLLLSRKNCKIYADSDNAVFRLKRETIKSFSRKQSDRNIGSTEDGIEYSYIAAMCANRKSTDNPKGASLMLDE